jgi:hypothetical protein
MGFSLFANHEDRVQVDFERPVIREAIVKTLDTFDWRYESPNPDLYIARVPMSSMSWGETFTVTVESGEIRINSQCYPLPQLFVWGKNKRNIDKFLTLFIAKIVMIAKFHEAIEQAIFDTSDSTPLERVIEES